MDTDSDTFAIPETTYFETSPELPSPSFYASTTPLIDPPSVTSGSRPQPATGSLPFTDLLLLSATFGLGVFFYAAAIIWVCRRARVYPKTIRTAIGTQVQRWAPFVYLLIVLGGLGEAGQASYLLIQYRQHANYPNESTYSAVVLLLAIGVTTTIFAGPSTIMFLHASWSMSPASSMGSHAVWTTVALIAWVAGAVTIILSMPAPGIFNCGEFAYCSSLQALIYIAAVEAGLLLLSMITIFGLAYQFLLHQR